jgi:hypothetical protein
MERTTMLRRLAWCSLPSPALSARQIDHIVACSHVNNVRDHISGMLLFTGGHFLSMLEGEERELQKLWLLLESDQRHCNLFRIGNDLCGNRLYPAWGSAYLEDSDVNDQIESLRTMREHKGQPRERGEPLRPLQTRASPAWAQVVHPILLRGRVLLGGGRERVPWEPGEMERVRESDVSDLGMAD